MSFDNVDLDAATPQEREQARLYPEPFLAGVNAERTRCMVHLELARAADCATEGIKAIKHGLSVESRMPIYANSARFKGQLAQFHRDATAIGTAFGYPIDVRLPGETHTQAAERMCADMRALKREQALGASSLGTGEDEMDRATDAYLKLYGQPKTLKKEQSGPSLIEDPQDEMDAVMNELIKLEAESRDNASR